jgi:hypothetical protein
LRRLFRAIGIDGDHAFATVSANAAGKNQTRAAGERSNSFEEVTPAVQVYGQGVVKVFFAFSTHHRREMKNGGIFAAADQIEYGIAIADIAGDLLHAVIFGGSMELGVEQHNLIDGFGLTGGTGQLPALQKSIT